MQTRISAAPFTTENDHETHSFVRRRDRYRHGRIRCNEQPGVGRDRAARAVEAALANGSIIFHRSRGERCAPSRIGLRWQFEGPRLLKVGEQS
jgi:hypothetical protein